MATVLEVVRTSLRRTSTSLDNAELLPLIEACKLDLKASGVSVVDDTDPLIQAAIRLFCKYQIENDEREFRFYETIKNGLAINSDYEEIE